MAGIKAVKVGNSKEDFSDQAIFPGTTQVVAFSGTSTQSVAVGSSTTMVQLVSTQPCFISIAASPTATASTSLYLPASTIMKLGITATHKVAALQVGSGGNLYITEAVSL